MRPGFAALEAPVILLLLSTLVFRVRSAEELAYNPLDAAAQFRVLCVALALALGSFALISRPVGDPPANGRLTSLPIRLYALYVVVVFLGAPLSVNLPLTGYRGVELLTALIVFVGARRIVGHETSDRIGTVLYWFVVALVVSVWVGLVVAPELATVQLSSTTAPIPWQLVGAFPSLSANSVGTLGVLLAIWSLARVRSARPRRLAGSLWTYALTGLGITTLIVAQYRTGYVAFFIAMLVYLLLGKRWRLASLIVIAALAIAGLASDPVSFAERAEPFALRGQTPEQASQLSSRVEFWGAAIPVWERSPLIGRGLLTGTRFEVLAPLGFTDTSAIHSTWIEALVGTGLVGLALIGLSFIATGVRALRRAATSSDLVPVLLLTVIAVRSITGNTFETFGMQAMMFLWLALSLADGGPTPQPDEPPRADRA